VIPITPQIIGPGIDEEYADAMDRIEKLEVLLKGFPPSNETREGRMIYQLMWLRQEITAKRLPIPLDQKYWATLGYLVGEGSLDHLGAGKLMGELATILSGVGMLKKRHHPVVVAMIDDLLTLSRRAAHLDPAEVQLLDDIRMIHAAMVSGKGQPPFDPSQYSGWKKVSTQTNLNQIPGFRQLRQDLGASVFEEFRPPPARKGPLPAPNPGMVWMQS
jgi:hypothetical protein